MLLSTLGRMPIRTYFTVLLILSGVPLLVVTHRVARAGLGWEAAVILAAALMGFILTVASRLQRSRVERVLASRQRQTEAILDASADAYVAMNARGEITAWSGQATATFGWSADEALGRTVSSLIIPPDLRHGHDHGLDRYLRTGHGPVLGSRVEVEARHRDGHRFPVELAVWMAEGESGPVFISFIHDITDRRTREAEYAAARDQAMEASRLKSEFVANMSHEIRTPMNGVIGMADLMSATRLSTEQREYLDTIRLSADALMHVIDDILDFSRIEAGKLLLEDQDFELRTVLDQVGALLAGTAQTKGVELVVDVDPSIPAVVRGDAGRLRQVLLNVAGNAVKFTDAGEVVIRATMKEGEEGLVHFLVSDTGPGILLEHQATLFDSFSQADASSTRRHGGTGLGLAISRRLVELMGGQIGLRSEPGHGSEFWFTVRFEVELNAQPPVRAPLKALQGLSVLVVDDNATNRNLLSRTLTGWGMSVTSAESAEEALQAVAAAHASGHGIDVALLDDQMPGGDGASVARTLADDERYRTVHRILLTSTSQLRGLAEDLVEGRLTKPVRESMLVDCIAGVMGRLESADAIRTATASPIRPAAGTKGRILLAEDNAVNQFVGQQMLTSLGYRVDVVADGSAAVEALVKGGYDAVLMDCQMPVMDGYEATAAIRDAEGTERRTPIIALTASAMDTDITRSLDAGMDDHLAKPVRAHDLERVLSLWSGRETDPAPAGDTLG